MWLLILVNRGRQHLGALFNLVAYYVLALPVGLTLAFHPRSHLGLQGLWIGTYYWISSNAAFYIMIIIFNQDKFSDSS